MCPLVPRKNHQPPRVSTLRQDVSSVSNEAALHRRCRADNSRHLFLTKPLINVDVAAVPLTVAAMEERQNSIVKEIMGKVVSAQSARNYSYQNIVFALFCYESDELRSHLLESWFIERMPQFPSEKKTYVKECLLACSPEDDNCPFILCNLTFAHFSNFLSTRTRRKGKNKGQENSLGNAFYDQAKSALIHLFQMSKYDISKDLAEKLKMSRRNEVFREW